MMTANTTLIASCSKKLILAKPDNSIINCKYNMWKEMTINIAMQIELVESSHKD